MELFGFADPSTYWLIVAFLVAALSAGLLGGYVTLNRRRAAPSEFADILIEADAPIIVTDAAGAIVAVNGAAAALGAKETYLTVSAFLGALTDNGDAACYRALTDDGAHPAAVRAERLTGARAGVLIAHRVSAGRIVWTLAEAPGPPSAAFDEDAPALFRLDEVGSVTAASAAFGRLPQTRREAAVESGRKIARTGASWVEIGAGHVVAGVASPVVGAEDFLVAPYEAGPPVEALLEPLPVGLVRMDKTGAVISANAAARALIGEGARPGARFSALVELYGPSFERLLNGLAEGEQSHRAEQARSRVDGRDMFLQVSMTRGPDEDPGAIVAVLNDATEVKTLEAQFVQSQKMQAVGQLAGGVAHDFNNLLTAILGHCDLMMLRTLQEDPNFADLTQIRQNANRAAALVRQLLAFSRKQTLRPRAVNVAQTLSELSHLLNRLLGERVTIEQEHERDLWQVWADERQFEQVIVNLAVNARDAMPEGGVVTIATRNLTIHAPIKFGRVAVAAGEYVRIEVSDTGDGIDPDKIGEIFDPFFTTKPQGQGTGLGLSTAYGIVKQMEGFIFADSPIGRGAVFTILLPRLSAYHAAAPQPQPEGEAQDAAADAPSQEGASILLVEDEAPVRTFAARALRLRGYQVAEADTAEAAFAAINAAETPFDLVVSDVVMPGTDGPAWVREARKEHPDMKVVFISGYAESVFRDTVEDVSDFTFLAKPFSLDELAETVREALT